MSTRPIEGAPPPPPAPFNLCEYYLDHNLEAGRADKVALVCGGERRTYAEIAGRARRLAAVLRRHGVRPEERVLIVLPDGFEFAETWFGVLRAGAVFAMVNPLLKRERVRLLLGVHEGAGGRDRQSSVLPELGPGGGGVAVL